MKAGAAARDLLPGFVNEALEALPIPKRMRWGAGEAQFVRPAHWLVMLLGRDVVPAAVLDVTAGNETRGHRFHAPKALRLASPASYERTLEQRGKVVADFALRRERIRAGVTALASEQGGTALISDALLDEVTALVEWPVPLAGRFEERFLALPRELLISVLQDHQRYFPVEDAARQAAALVHHREQCRQHRHERGARRQRARGAPASFRCGVLLGAGSQAATGCAPAAAGCRHLPEPAGFDRRQGATHCAAGARDCGAHQWRWRHRGACR